jgi:hypothetical protein
VARQLYFDGLLDSQSLAKIDLRVLVAPHFKLDRPLDAIAFQKFLFGIKFSYYNPEKFYEIIIKCYSL